MANTEAAAVQRRARTGVWILGVLSACLLILAAAVVYAAVREPEVWDPLGEYPPQTVTSRVAGIRGPAARLDETVDVEGVKCGPEDPPGVTVLTTLNWQSVDPPGSSWPRGGSSAVREPGCQSLTFHNIIPDAVAELVEAQVDAGFSEPVWEITGTETPVGEDGRQGAPRRWVTERFVLVP